MPSYAAILGQLYRLTAAPSDAELLRRWVDRRDEDAFAALVARHGRMVYGVCRRMLGNRHDAEDAFQAVFLILARKAATIRHPEALPGWLHGVAVRLAYKARRTAARRRCGVDCSTAEPHDPHPDPLDTLSARDLLALIDREIASLPEVYRLPLVLCDLEERTQEEAARLLGWTLGSLRGRLLRGRERLRTRLARRGLAPTVFVATLLQGSAEAATLTAGVSRLAVRFADCPTSADVSPSVAALVREGIGGVVLMKLKLVSALLLAAATLAAGAGLLAWPNPVPTPPQAESNEDSKQPSAPPSAKPQVRRDRAGDPLPEEALSRLGSTRFRDGGPSFVGPDGKTLVSCGRGGVRVWDTADGKEIPRFPQDLKVYRIALSPDGKELAIRVRTDNPAEPPIAIYEYATGRLLRRFGDRETLSGLAYSPDGKVLASSIWVLSPSDWRRQSEIELWDPVGGRRLHILKGHKRAVMSIAFSPDSKTLVSTDHKTIHFWDVATGKELRQIEPNLSAGKIAWSPDGKLLATTHRRVQVNLERGTGYTVSESQVRFWDAATGKELRRLVMPAIEGAPTGGVFHSLIFAPDSKMFLTGGSDGVVRFWDPATGREMRQFPGFVHEVGGFVFTPDGKELVMLENGTIHLLDLATGRDRVPTFGHRAGVSSISVTPDGRTVATLGEDNTLRLWELETGKELRSRGIPPTPGYMFKRRVRDDGKTYLIVGADRRYRLMDLASGKERAVLHGHNTSYPFALSPDGKTLASVNPGKEVRLLDPATGEVRHLLTKVKQLVSGLAFSGDSRTLLVWDMDRIVTVWDVATGKKRLQFPVPNEIGRNPENPRTFYTTYKATLSPDGNLIAFGLKVLDPKAKQGILPVLDTNTGKEVCRFATGKGGEDGMTFSPDSKSLVWAEVGTDAIVLGEIATGRERHRLTGSTGSINSIYSSIYTFAFSPDGKRLVSTSDDTSALVWDLTGRLILGNKFAKALSAEELDTYWNALASEDAATGFRAVQALAADPIHSVPYLRTHLHPIARADEKRLQQWIADLDSAQFAVREKARSELEKAGGAALHAMRKTLDEKPSLEMRRRLEQLIDKQEREQWSPSAENLRSRRALEVLERAGTAESKDVLTSLANGAPGAWQTLDAKATLQRLAQRFSYQGRWPRSSGKE